MKQNLLINGETLGASQEGMLATELYLITHYLFRRNVLNGKVECAAKPAEGQEPLWKPLTQSALNSIIIRAKRECVCDGGSPKSDIVEYVNSDEIGIFDPIADYLEHLPKWNGENHVARLFNRLPGVDSELMGYLATWLRSVVAHWLQMDTIHGNECVPTLIGAQGCGKTTFFVRLLPPHLRAYYLDHLNLSNKFNNDEVARIQQLNQNYLEQKDIADIIRICFRKPEPGELAQSMNCERLLEIITKEYPSVKATHGTKVYLGKAMHTLGFESTDCGHVAHYKVIPLKAA